MRQYEPGDIIRLLPEWERAYYVYELVGDDDAVFYVGMSHNPAARLTAHCAGTASAKITASAKRMLETVRLHREVKMRIVSVHSSKAQASMAETAHALTFEPGVLINSIIPGHYSRQWSKVVRDAGS